MKRLSIIISLIFLILLTNTYNSLSQQKDIKEQKKEN